MKNRIYKLLAVMMSVVALSACDDWTPGEGSAFAPGTGGVQSSSMNVTVTDPPSAPTGRATTDVSGYLVTIMKRGTNETATYKGAECSWTCGSMPSEIITLEAGDYTVSVRSHNPENAAFDRPYFEGSKDFTIENNKVTDIGTVKCTFQAVKVGIVYNSELKEGMDASTASVTVEAGKAGTELKWGATETRYGYFILSGDDNRTLVATFKGIVNSQELEATKTIDDVKTGAYYILTFSLKKGNVQVDPEFGEISGTTSGISIDFEVVESEVDSKLEPGEDPSGTGDGDKNPDDEEWPENPDNPENPDDPNTGDDKAFTFANGEGSDIDFNGVNVVPSEEELEANPRNYIVEISSIDTLAHLYVEIISESLTDEMLTGVGLAGSFDLAEPGDLADALSGSFGFPIEGEVIGQTHVTFDITPFIPLLNIYGNELHEFQLKVVDQKGNQVIQSLKFQTK